MLIMRKFFLKCFLTIPFLGVQLLYSQNGDSLSHHANLPDTGRIGIQSESRPSNKRFHYENLAIPSAMVVYGVIGLKNNSLKRVNEQIHEELWTENPHKKIHADDYLQWAPAVAVYGLNVVGIKGKHNLVDRTVIYGISTLLMSSVVYEVKKISKEMRPDGSDLYSFPSGHTANAFATAEFLRQEYKDVSLWYGVGGYAAAAVTGYLRMYNNKHWLSDVIAGAGVGIISTNVAYIIYPPVKRIFFKKEHASSTIILPAYQHGIVSVGAVHRF